MQLKPVYSFHSFRLEIAKHSVYEYTVFNCNSRDLYNMFDITEFRYKGIYINGLEVLGEISTSI